MVLVHVYTFAGLFILASDKKKVPEKALAVLKFVGNTLFFTILTTLLAVTDCSTGVLGDGLMLCFKNEHSTWAYWSLICATAYSVGSFALIPSTSAAADVEKTQTGFTLGYSAFCKLLKMVLIGVQVYLFENHLAVLLTSSMVFCMEACWLLSFFPSVYWPVSYWKGCLCICLIWSSWCSVWSWQCGGVNSDVAFRCLWGGSLGVISIFMILFILLKRTKTDPNKVHVQKVFLGLLWFVVLVFVVLFAISPEQDDFNYIDTPWDCEGP